ncbi:MAG: hypothetical protein HQK56_18065, partial [Deltaproteobacteria bacterium]|nr:hypothetical protein [Deltaproteobacteria bacterium]
MDKKTAVYICTGCGIGDALDMDALAKVAKAQKAPICKTHGQMCSQEGADLIKQDIAAEGVNTIAIAACSPRSTPESFNFPTPLLNRENPGNHWSGRMPPGPVIKAKETIRCPAETTLARGWSKLAKMTMPC